MKENPSPDEFLTEKEKEAQARGNRPRVLLHACCAPCSSAVLERLTRSFDITLFYYNPNIAPEKEYRFRAEELRRLLSEMTGDAVGVIECPYTPEDFDAIAEGREDLPEKGERCRLCYELRLRKTAGAAKEGGYDYFCTTLTVSPHKNAAWLNGIGGAISEETGVPYLYSDFKKHDGYKRSVALSKEYGLYRQPYCGCVYSERAYEKKLSEKTETEKR